MSIDFDNKIYSNLESQRIRGKFLSLIDRSDLRNLGFELFEHQRILQKSIKKLIEKYPIPQEKEMGFAFSAGNDEIEGVNVKVTYTTDNEIQDKYKCPITKKLMKFPVVAYDGCVYEKKSNYRLFARISINSKTNQ